MCVPLYRGCVTKQLAMCVHICARACGKAFEGCARAHAAPGGVLAFITDEDVLQVRHSLPRANVHPFISTPSLHAISAREGGCVSIHFRPRTCCTYTIHFPTGRAAIHATGEFLLYNMGDFEQRSSPPSLITRTWCSRGEIPRPE